MKDVEDIIHYDKGRIRYQKIIKEDIKNNLEIYKSIKNVEQILFNNEIEIVCIYNETYIISMRIQDLNIFHKDLCNYSVYTRILSYSSSNSSTLDSYR